MIPKYQDEEGKLQIKKTKDFEIDGTGAAREWEKATWINLPFRHGPDTTYKTKSKILYSDEGIYFLFECEDQILTATLNEDFANLYEEDVVEVFLWTDEEYPIYFEYELSPLNYELPILIPNFEGKFFGWRPWQYEGPRKTRHATSVKGGKKESGAKIDQWTAEFFIPFALLAPLKNVPPQKGTTWRANMYRIDYDGEGFKSWQWQPTSGSFHEYKKFGTFIFD
ncbi:hypothetical protein BH23BAC1_BH23BAC1_47180 [soil metagenome]